MTAAERVTFTAAFTVGFAIGTAALCALVVWLWWHNRHAGATR